MKLDVEKIKNFIKNFKIFLKVVEIFEKIDRVSKVFIERQAFLQSKGKVYNNCSKF